MRPARTALLCTFLLPGLARSAEAATYNGNPGNYLALLSLLQQGDTLVLQAGTYTSGLPISNKNGNPGSPIVIEGPESGPAAVFRARSCCNTVSITDSSYVEIRNLELDGLGMPGIDAVKAEGPSGDANFAHHITIENLYIHGHDGDQQTVGISTKCPAWDWVIRRNVIDTAGTGIYLGNSDGSAPFAGGLIEGNLIVDTIGYNMQIKHQNNRLPAMPASASTIIRHNVFSKASGASTGADARPNLLVGHWPLVGAGSTDVYQIYGNFFWANPTGEPLFQGEGNVALYDNLFVNNVGPAVWIQPQNDLPRTVRVFNNTVVALTTGIRVTGGDLGFQQRVIGNAVSAATPISAADQAANVVDSFGNAGAYLVNPGGSPTGSPTPLDLFPRVGTLTGPLIDSSSFNTFEDWNRDFNRFLHGGTFRGAYAGEGANPGWLPQLERKPLTAPPPSISVGDVAVTEGNTGTIGAVFTVSLSEPSGQIVSVFFATTNGTAMAPGDYTATAATLTFAPGVTSQPVVVAVVGDLLDEPDETFTLDLSAPVNAAVGDGQGLGTILDDEPPPQIVVEDCAAEEGDAGSTPCPFNLSLSAASSLTVTVDYATAGGSATSGVDFVAAAGSITFSPGTVGPLPVAVTVSADSTLEGDETFVLNLSNQANATLPDPQGLGTILDDDAPSLSSEELGHGSSQLRSIAAGAPPVDLDLFRLGQPPRSSWEIVADATSGDIGPGLLLERLAADNTTVLQTGVAVGTGSSMSMRWENTLPHRVTSQHIRVRSADCTTQCGTDDVYRIRAWETTYAIPRFNNAGSQLTVLVLQNLGPEAVAGHAWFWSPSGVLLYQQAFTVFGHGSVVLNTNTVPALQGRSGTVIVTHDGGYGALTGKTVALEPATGFSFDSPMLPRVR